MKELQDPCISAICAKLRQIIKNKEIRQKDIADNAEIPVSTLGSLLNGKSQNPSFLLIKKIVDALGISIDYLLGKPAMNASDLHKEMFEIFDLLSEVGKKRFIEFAKFMQDKK